MKTASLILPLSAALALPLSAAGQSGTCPADAATKHVVVTVAINDYAHPERFPHLDSPEPDADAIEAELVKKFGYERYADVARSAGIADVVPLRNKNATNDAIYGITDNLRKVLCDKDDLVFFFSGHGTFRPDNNDPTKPSKGFIVPYDALASGYDGAHLVGVRELLENLNDLPAKHLLVILDACHSGIALKDALDAMKDVPDQARAQLSLQEREQRKSRRVIVSALWNQTAADAVSAGHSVFAGTLLEGLEGAAAGKKNYFDDYDLGNYLRDNISGTEKDPQTSDHQSFGDHDSGSLVLPLDLDLASLYQATLASLINGDTSDFRNHAAEAIKRDPDDPRALALGYRLALSEGNVDQAGESLDHLYDMCKKSQPAIGTTQFRDLTELRTARSQLAFWKGVLAMPVSAGKAPVTIHAFTGKTEREQDLIQLSGSGDYPVPEGSDNLWFKLKATSKAMYVYAFMVDAAGRVHSEGDFLPARLNVVDQDSEQLSRLQYAPMPGDFEEWHFIFSPRAIDAFAEPPSETSGGGDPPAPQELTNCFHYVAYVRPATQ